MCDAREYGRAAILRDKQVQKVKNQNYKNYDV